MGNRICDLFGIKYPIVQGAMQWLSVPELAAAVSNAGGLGTITSATYPSKEALAAEIRRMKTMTDKPFSVNVSLFPSPSAKEKTKEYIEAILEEGAPVVETSGRSPEEFVPVFKAAGIKLMHKVPGVKYAKKAESIGVDAVTIVGYECGGHPGMADATSMILIPKASQTLSIPLIAGGGIVDARSFVAALALGADAVVMGTRFIASKECLIHSNFKELVLNGNENDTVIIQRSIKNAMRTIKNPASAKVLEMEEKGATLEELMTVIAGKITRECYKSGDTEGCTFPIGQGMGLIDKIKPVKEIIDDIIDYAAKTSIKINSDLKTFGANISR